MIIIGIDLGTTNSLVSYWTEDGPVIIPNALGDRLTPSVVSVNEEDEVFVGKIAEEMRLTNPENTASVFKRSMGSKKVYHLGGKDFLPEELSALLIRSLKADAEAFLGLDITEAVISVPAYFSDAQRKATKRAGELAGLKVDRLVTEPTAAAIAYGINKKEVSEKFLVFDLGGGTFDVSILELFNNIMEVRAVAGNNYLGGEDFTEVLVEQFIEKNGLKKEQLTIKERTALKKHAEVAKCSFAENRKVSFSAMVGEQKLELTITLSEYETAVKSLLARLREPVERALKDASLKLKDIDFIILVGGATKLSIIRSFVSRLFGKMAFININPDEVVALGAGVQAALKGKDAVIKEVILTDVCPFTLGTTVASKMQGGFIQSGYFLPIIERNSVIPISKVERLYTLTDNQKVLNVEILQGESRVSKDNIYLGELNIPVPPRAAGQEAIDVRYTYDINGILEVEVKAVSTGISKKVVIEKNPGAMSNEEINQRLEELDYLKIHPRENYSNKLLIAKGERLFEQLTGIARQEVGELLKEFDGILQKQDPREIDTERSRIMEVFEAYEQEEVF